jgi:hypothetical protein
MRSMDFLQCIQCPSRYITDCCVVSSSSQLVCNVAAQIWQRLLLHALLHTNACCVLTVTRLTDVSLCMHILLYTIDCATRTRSARDVASTW